MDQVCFRKVDYTVIKIVNDIEMGEIALPDIQRPFIWKNTKVRDLFDSMYRGYPIGYFLFWENATDEFSRQIGVEGKQKYPRLLIIDGQQRLTSLYAVIKGKNIIWKNYDSRKINIAFNPLEEKFDVTDSAIMKNPDWIPDISRIWSGSSGEYAFVKEYLTRLKEKREINNEIEEKVYRAINRLYNLINYPLTCLELASSIPDEEMSEIFVRINSAGVTLNQSDFILTLMSVYWSEGRDELEKFCEDARHPGKTSATPFNRFINPTPDQLLRAVIALGFRRGRLDTVYSLLRGRNLQTREYSEEERIKNLNLLKEAQKYTLDLLNWHEFLKTPVHAGFRSGSYISSPNTLFYAYALWLIGKRDFGLEIKTLRRIIAAWTFMSLLTGRYTGSPESRLEQDLKYLRNTGDPDEFVRILKREMEAVLTEDFWSITLPNELATSASRSPARFAYIAALSVLNAPVLFSDMKVNDLLDPSVRGPKSPLELHHLFPRNYLEKCGIVDIPSINQTANYTLIEWTDNIAISDKAPKEYVPEIEKRFTEQQLKEMYSYHALWEGWYDMDYFDFLEERRKRMANVIRSGFMRLVDSSYPEGSETVAIAEKVQQPSTLLRYFE
ncbi:MAG: DUF262 domain-containing protein [Methanomassiliicoccales archaeon]|jgi:hypothetical protein|nr:DUF262 domain-containing protein [Methanomassiliicoccales archaeon]